MTDIELWAEIDKIEAFLPNTHDDLIKQIDRFIFGAQKGYDFMTEYTARCFNKESEYTAVYKRTLAAAYLAAENNQVAATARKEFATMHSTEAEIALLKAENDVRIARMRREQWLERLNSYKKIKNDNTNMRGGG